jgi:hypothetical protein
MFCCNITSRCRNANKCASIKDKELQWNAHLPLLFLVLQQNGLIVLQNAPALRHIGELLSITSARCCNASMRCSTISFRGEKQASAGHCLKVLRQITGCCSTPRRASWQAGDVAAKFAELNARPVAARAQSGTLRRTSAPGEEVWPHAQSAGPRRSETANRTSGNASGAIESPRRRRRTSR